MSQFIFYKGVKYKAVDSDDDSVYLEKLKSILAQLSNAEKDFNRRIQFAKSSIESAIKNPDKYNLKSEYADRKSDMLRLKSYLSGR